jgi:hypothetical protein
VPSIQQQKPGTVNAKKKPVLTATPVQYEADDGWGRIDGITLLLYGASGTGKTSVWATFPGPIRVYLCSGGSKPGELKSVDSPEYRKKIKPKVIESMASICDHLEADKGKFATTVLDHASGLAGLALKEYLRLDDIPAVKKWGMANQKDWGNINEKVIEILRPMLNFPGNVVFVAQEKVFKGKEGDEVVTSDILKPMTGPAMTPGVLEWLFPAVDFVLQTSKIPKFSEVKVQTVEGELPTVMRQREKGVRYIVRTEDHDIFQTKFRIPKGRPRPEYIEDCDYSKLMAVIEGR